MPQTGLSGRTTACLASFALFATACAGVDEGRNDAEVEQLRLGRVHVVVESGTDDASDVEVSARFAYVRGLDEEFVRARIEMPVLAHDILHAPDCIATDQLTSAEGEPAGDIQELVLVDAGDLRVDIGETRYEVPLSLVPDLLPYMSGVEYVMYSDELASMPDEGMEMAVHASGSITDELPPFSTEANVPGALELTVDADAFHDRGRQSVVLGWRGGESDETITITLTGLLGDEAQGAQVTCLVPNTGRAALPLGSLFAVGLPTDAEAIQIQASRVSSSTFDAGDFAGSELIVERRETAILR